MRLGDAVFGGGAFGGLLILAQHVNVPHWAWWLLALTVASAIQFQAFRRVVTQRDEAQRDPRQIAEIRRALLNLHMQGETIRRGYEGDLGASYSKGNSGEGRDFLHGTRAQALGAWREDVRGSLRGDLPGRLVEFDALADLPVEEEVADPDRITNADEINVLMSRLTVELRWLDQMYLLLGLNLGGRKPSRIDP